MSDREIDSTAGGSHARPRPPAPGRPARGSASGRAIMAVLDLLGRRWALRVIWELRGGPLVFRSLQERCEGMSSSVLNERLRELRAAGIVAAGGDGYSLSHEGRRLLEAYAPLAAWAERWEARTRAQGEELPPRAAARRAARRQARS